MKTARQDHETTYTRPYKYLSYSILFNLLLKMFKEEAFTISLGSAFQQLIPLQLNKFWYLFLRILGLEILKSLPLDA